MPCLAASGRDNIIRSALRWDKRHHEDDRLKGIKSLPGLTCNLLTLRAVYIPIPSLDSLAAISGSFHPECKVLKAKTAGTPGNCYVGEEAVWTISSNSCRGSGLHTAP